MPVPCAVPGCQSKGVQSHLFPHNLILGQKWLEAVSSPKLATMAYDEIRKKQYRVCYLHFAEGSWIPTFVKPRLKHDAVPTLHLPDTRVLRCVVPTDQSINELADQIQETRVEEIVPADLSPHMKYVRSPSKCEFRRSSLKTPPKCTYNAKVENAESDALNVKKNSLNSSWETIAKRQVDCSLEYLNESFMINKRFRSKENALTNDENCNPSPIKIITITDDDLDYRPCSNTVVTEGSERRRIEAAHCDEPQFLEERRREATTCDEPPLLKDRKCKRVGKKGDEPTLLQARKQRRLLAKRDQLIDFSPEFQNIFKEVARLRKKLFQTVGQLKRYGRRIYELENEIHTLRNKVHSDKSNFLI